MARDLQRVEELSSTAALGLWADDVVLALDRAFQTESPAPEDVELLGEAATILEAARDRTEKPLTAPPTGSSLAATESALAALINIAGREETEADQGKLLGQMAETLRRAAGGEMQGDTKALDPVMALFAAVSEFQLIASNSVLSSRKASGTWTEIATISSSY